MLVKFDPEGTGLFSGVLFHGKNCRLSNGSKANDQKVAAISNGAAYNGCYNGGVTSEKVPGPETSADARIFTLLAFS